MGIDPDWVIRRSKKIEKLVGYRPIDFLGDGSYGVVFTTNRPNIALKITSHKLEAQTLAMIRRLRRRGIELPGIVNIRKLIHFKTSCKKVSNPFSPVYSTFATEWVKQDFNRRAVDLFIIVRDLLDSAPIPSFSTRLNNYIDRADKVNKAKYMADVHRVFRKFPNLKRTLSTLVNNEIYLWDIRPSNTGWNKHGQLVIHDVVAAKPLPKITIPSFGRIR